MEFFDSLFGRKVAAVQEGTTFHRGDRIVSKVGKDSSETTLKPEEIGHRVEVLLGAGKTGTVVRGHHKRKDWIYIQWDAQKWQEPGKRRKGVEMGDFVQIPSFESNLHIEYVVLVPTAL